MAITLTLSILGYEIGNNLMYTFNIVNNSEINNLLSILHNSVEYITYWYSFPSLAGKRNKKLWTTLVGP